MQSDTGEHSCGGRLADILRGAHDAIVLRRSTHALRKLPLDDVNVDKMTCLIHDYSLSYIPAMYA